MKKALCVNTYQDLAKLVNNELETVEAKLVDREICEKPENGLQQLIPYVVFYSLDAENGKLKFIQYLRPGQGEGEERLQGKTSIGFGGHIDQETEIVSSEIVLNDDGSTSYKMSLQNIMETAIKAGIREVKEELNIDLLQDIGDVISKNEIAFFHGNLEEEVNQVHTGISIPVKLTEEQFMKLKETAVFNEAEIEKLDILGINIDMIVEQMDITPTLNHVIEELVTKYNLEQWSTMMFNYLSRKEINDLMSEITYKDIVALSYAKQAQKMQQASQEEVTV